MANTIKLKRSSTTGDTPTTSQMELGEIAVNTFDGKLFIRGNNGSDFVNEISSISQGGGSNADTLDNLDSSQFLRSDANDTATGNINFTGNLTKSGNTVWHEGNDGSGSGLDADTLDGIEASAFATDAEVAVIKQDIYNTAAANYTLNGGGTVTVTNGTSLKWSARVLAIPVERSEFSSSGYIDINCPTSGTITYYANGAISTITCDTDGIELPTWSALYYQVTPGQASSSDQTKFRVVNYQNSSWAPEEGWLLLAVRNSDSASDGITFLPNGGIKFPSDVVTATFDVDTGSPSWLATRDVATTSANGLMSSSDKTKLNGIETGATGDQTATEILTAIKTVDGTGSGLDADTLDGIQASAFVQNLSDLGITSTSAELNILDVSVQSPTDGQALTYSTANGLEWGSVASDSSFVENDQTITESYTVASGKNAQGIGPITISNGATITVSTGSKLVIT